MKLREQRRKFQKLKTYEQSLWSDGSKVLFIICHLMPEKLN